MKNSGKTLSGILRLTALLCMAPLLNAEDRLRMTEQIEDLREAHLKETGEQALLPTAEKNNLNERSRHRNVRLVMQKHLETLPVVEVNSDPDKVAFTSLDLSAHGYEVEQGTEEKPKKVTYYAFRFRTPSEKGPFYWSATRPGSRQFVNWYVIEKGELFRYSAWRPRYRLPETIPGIGRKDEEFLVYRYDPGFFEPDTEYVIATEIPSSKVEDFRVSLNLFPEGFKVTSHMEVFPMLYPQYIPHQEKK